MQTEIEIRAYYNSLIKSLENNLKFTQEALAKSSDKFHAAESQLSKIGYKEVMFKHGLDWFYAWELDPDFPHRYEKANERD